MPPEERSGRKGTKSNSHVDIFKSPRGYRTKVDYRLFLPSDQIRIDYSEILSEAELPCALIARTM